MTTRGALSACVAMMLALASPLSIACDWGDPSRPLQDEVRGYYDADVVFLALIRTLEDRAPAGAGRFWTAAATYDVIEVYRGAPAGDGVLASESSRPGVDGVPPSSCTGGTLSDGVVGATLLVFASRQDSADAVPHYTIDRFNTKRIGDCRECAPAVRRMRLYGEAERVPLKQN